MDATPAEETNCENGEAPEQDDMDLLLKTLEADFEGKAGNKSLRDALGWSGNTARYWKAHSRALDNGEIVSGRGKGGSVRLATLDAEDTDGPDITSQTTKGTNKVPSVPRPAQQEEKPKEADLYPGAKVAIENGWVKSANYDDYLLEITAFKGKAATGGKWSRPDLSILAVKAFPYLPSRIFDIVTFEIKPENQISVEAIFEALSHQQFATRAYAVFHTPNQDGAENFLEKWAHGERILGTARKHGVGVITAGDISDWETWDELVPAERSAPDPEQANRFIATCFSEETQEKIIKWHK